MQTKLLRPSEDPAAIEEAGALLRAGEVVGIPTETVYGLAADALNPQAVKRIFEAKGRPQDNPLIVHIADLSMVREIATEFPPEAQKLADAFWPGPLTIILPKQDKIPMVTSGGLNTVGIRFPVHPMAQAIIREGMKNIAAGANHDSAACHGGLARQDCRCCRWRSVLGRCGIDGRVTVRRPSAAAASGRNFAGTAAIGTWRSGC